MVRHNMYNKNNQQITTFSYGISVQLELAA